MSGLVSLTFDLHNSDNPTPFRENHNGVREKVKSERQETLPQVAELRCYLRKVTSLAKHRIFQKVVLPGLTAFKVSALP